MKRIFALFALLVLAAAALSSCGTPQEAGAVRIASLKGPTSMGLVSLYSEADAGELSYTVSHSICGSADEITPQLAAGELDLAAVPANLAAALYNKGTDLVVLAVNTLGVLELLETGDSIHSVADLAGRTVYSTGKGTTPQYALEYLLASAGLAAGEDVTVEYLSEATQVAAMLQQSETAVAVLPQPFATTALASNPALRVAFRFADVWREVTGGGELVTGVLVARRSFVEQNPKLAAQFLSDYARSADFARTNPAETAELVAAFGILPSAAVAEKALPGCSITLLTGAEMKAALSGYLQTLFDRDPAAVGGSMPDDAFYHEAE